MDAELYLGSRACEEGALHGLGHWQGRHPREIACIVADYLDAVRPSERLRQYAEAAQAGLVE